MEVYTDAARDDDIAAMAWRIVLDDGDTIEDSRYITGNYTSMEAEYFALLDGLRIARRYGQKVSVYTDCEPLVRKMRVPDDDLEWHERREGCHRLLQKFESWEMEWTPRSNNSRADRLAYEALERGRRS